MRAGRLRNLVSIQSRSGAQNAYGEVTNTFTEVTSGEVWAGIEPIRDAEARRAGGNDEILTHKIVMRYLSGVNATHQIVFGSRTFQIVSVINRDERNMELEILCKERV